MELVILLLFSYYSSNEKQKSRQFILTSRSDLNEPTCPRSIADAHHPSHNHRVRLVVSLLGDYFIATLRQDLVRDRVEEIDVAVVLEAVLDLHVEVGVEQVLVVVHVLDGVLELEELRLCLDLLRCRKRRRVQVPKAEHWKLRLLQLRIRLVVLHRNHKVQC